MSYASPADQRLGAATTVAVHLLVVVGWWVMAHQHRASQFRTYEVTLQAAPLPAPEVKRAPAEAPPVRREETVPTPKAKPARTTPVAPPPPPPPSTVPRAETPPVTKTPVAPAPGQTPSMGQDVVTLKQAGMQFPYPEYLRRIQNAIRQRWDNAMFRPGYDAKIEFTILPDGTVPDASVSIVKSSGNALYDDHARSAIESASNQKAFGPLPSGFSGSLPIIFDFAQDAKGPS